VKADSEQCGGCPVRPTACRLRYDEGLALSSRPLGFLDA
jgi:hypothetical protein